VKELCCKRGFSEASFYLLRSKYGGMSVSDAKRLKALEAENAKLKKLLAEALLENEVTKDALRKKMVTAPERREPVRWMQARGLTERRGLAIVSMSASSPRYRPPPDRNVALWARIVALVQRHRRYGVGIVHLKLQQAGAHVNYKRVERLYRFEQLQIRRRRRRTIPDGERQPLIRPGQANEVWSMDFAFDREASGRTIKSLVAVDDATHESVAIVPEHTIGDDHLTRILDGTCARCGTPADFGTDNGPEFTGKAVLTWAHRKGIALRLIEPGKPNQNAYVESFNGRFRDDCRNEHWFVSLAHARAVIEAWR
jgi:transposase InsO family protein